jgi:hypothetical protein
LSGAFIRDLPIEPAVDPIEPWIGELLIEAHGSLRINQKSTGDLIDVAVKLSAILAFQIALEEEHKSKSSRDQSAANHAGRGDKQPEPQGMAGHCPLRSMT